MSFEPNDTIFDAVYTGLSSYYPGSFVTDGEIGDNPSLFFGEDDVDFFQVELDAGDRLTADIDAEVFGSSLDSVLRLFDSFGNEVAVNHEDFGLDSFLDFTASTYDTYYVGVSSFSNFDYDPFVEGSGFGNSTGEYTLNLNLEDNSSSLEPNDTIFDAVYTGLSSYYPGSFVTDGEIGDNPNLFFGENDVDFFQVELDAGDRLTADIDAEVFGSSLDSVLRLFDSFGNEVAVNDDDFGLDSFLDFTASVFDTYYLGVSSYTNFDYDPFVADSGFGNSTGEYTLDISLSNPCYYEICDV